MAQFLSRIILHLVFIKKDWQLYLDRSTRALMHACLPREGLSRPHRRSLSFRRCKLSVSKLIEEFIEMDQGAGRALSALLLAEWLWSLLCSALTVGMIDRLHRERRRAPQG